MTPVSTTGKIRILDPATINLIAAGEVVDRPASVVKELVENAIDADAQSIRIEISSSKGAITSIRVSDDGTGMSADDAVLAFVPHATSKIQDASDLVNISTLGFRGEALASIAAVSRVTLITRLRNSQTIPGTKVIIEGGRTLSATVTGSPEGTVVIVENLFFNTPARKKFLKRLTTELVHITAVMEGIALAHPDLSFRLIHNSRTHLETDKGATLHETVSRIFGQEQGKTMIRVDDRFLFLSINGFISLPSHVRKNKSRILVSINNRFVSSPAVTDAIIEGYGNLLPQDRYPVAFLSLTIDTAFVDVNVHPAKKLVRLSREEEIRAAVSRAVRDALGKADLIPMAVFREKTGSNPITSRVSAGTYYGQEPVILSGVSEADHSGTMITDRQLRQTELSTGIPPKENRVPAMDIIGQFGGIYLLAATESGELFVIDQHAAHERILYELIHTRTQGSPTAQELIEPVVLRRSLRDAAVLRGLLPSLAGEGFLIEEFGRDTFVVRTVPVIFNRVEQAAELIADIVDDVTREELKPTVSRREQLNRIIACRGAIKAGTVCTGEQCKRLLHQLTLTENPFTCPHGRPTMIRFSRKQLDTLFHRI